MVGHLAAGQDAVNESHPGPSPMVTAHFSPRLRRQLDSRAFATPYVKLANAAQPESVPRVRKFHDGVQLQTRGRSKRRLGARPAYTERQKRRRLRSSRGMNQGIKHMSNRLRVFCFGIESA